MVLTFDDVNERTQLHTNLTGLSLGDGEAVVMETKIKDFSIASLNPSSDGKDSNNLKLGWKSISVINKKVDEIYSPNTILAMNLRVIIGFNGGSFTDRFNIGPGELKFRLDVNSTNELKVLRQPQLDMTISASESQVPVELPKELTGLLATIASSETTRTYKFPGPQDLHSFQAALTGFSVLFDCMATSFHISRRRMVVPIYKKWNAATTRLQLVHREKVTQLVAFFENFNHGDCMNFALKSTDIFESNSRSGKFSLRIVDAKFAMPKARGEGEAAADSGFVCLDMPDYPGEHDDITIGFENESGMFLQHWRGLANKKLTRFQTLRSSRALCRGQ